MNIYVKSFNRPFYLDRCLRSIKDNVTNYDSIIILEDGTLTKYQEKIKALHPDVQWRYSNADDDKFRLLKEENFEEIKKRYTEPGVFWVTEIAKEKNKFFFFMEDDAFITQKFDLKEVEGIMVENKLTIVKFLWSFADISGFKHIFKRKKIDDTKAIHVFSPTLEKYYSVYQLYVLALSVFDKDYFLSAFKGLKQWADEVTQLKNILHTCKDNNILAFGESSKWFLRQGWAIPGRSDSFYYNIGIKQHVFMDTFNEAWFSGNMNPMEGYPNDFSQKYLLEVLSTNPEINEQAKVNWKKWNDGTAQMVQSEDDDYIHAPLQSEPLSEKEIKKSYSIALLRIRKVAFSIKVNGWLKKLKALIKK